MHTPIDATEIGQVVDPTRPAQGERIEQPHLDVFVAVQGRQPVVQALDAVVVEQKPHANAAVGRLEQSTQHQRAGQVIAPDVVLHIERAFGGVCQQITRSECVERVVKWVQAALAGMLAELLGERLAQLCLLPGFGRQGGRIGRIGAFSPPEPEERHQSSKSRREQPLLCQALFG